jgi:putative Holliday junction resolvase
MRILGVDVGQRRVGLAISDPSATLARPLMTLQVTSAADAVAQVAAEVARLGSEEDGLEVIVVGMPSRLDGSASAETPRVIAFIDRLKTRAPMPIVEQDERLSSREAESRLALRERDWRKRKQLLDAAAAAVILQDYLDRLRPDSAEPVE